MWLKAQAAAQDPLSRPPARASQRSRRGRGCGAMAAAAAPSTGGRSEAAGRRLRRRRLRDAVPRGPARATQTEPMLVVRLDGDDVNDYEEDYFPSALATGPEEHHNEEAEALMDEHIEGVDENKVEEMGDDDDDDYFTEEGGFEDEAKEVLEEDVDVAAAGMEETAMVDHDFDVVEENVLGLWDPAGFPADGSTDNDARGHQTELKHGRMNMLVALGSMNLELAGMLSGFLMFSAVLKGADTPDRLCAIPEAPATGWARTVAFGAFCDLSQDLSAGVGAAAAGSGWKVLTSSDASENTAEVANARLAMMAFTGMLFHERLIGPAMPEQKHKQQEHTPKGDDEHLQMGGKTSKGTLVGDVMHEQDPGQALMGGAVTGDGDFVRKLTDKYHELTALRRRYLSAEVEDSTHDGAQLIMQSVSFSERTMAALRCKSSLEIVEGGPYLILLNLATAGFKDIGVDGVLSALRALAKLAQELGETCARMGWRGEARRSIGDGVRFSRVASSLRDKHGIFLQEAEQPA